MAAKDESRHYGGRGDPVRSMELLWGTGPAPRSRGPRQGLTVERIVRAGIEIADAEGLAALSMRRVADRLGVGTMSLYTYVPSKAELVDVMFDRALGPEDRPVVEGGWRERLTAVAWAEWDLYRRHPWMLQVMAMSRPPLGPNGIAAYDHNLRAVDGIGLTELEMDSVVNMVSVYVQGSARAAAQAATSVTDTGVTDAEWWSTYGPLLEKVFDPEKHPTAARVGAVAGETYQSAYDAKHGFEFGLARILDGVATLVDSRG
ncbi:TetR/AcrR family transcriptional regulator [Actinophytocola oryzae]|uniref:TetR family transcriptional regulator n=1 Tax=Actinophytocola oryzae TaxID=502181 RepID=A0A4R7VR72_9PSEU|nr:TetR/AcrR family transcriptional regulator [Actinophytocola oryzae]TDV52273.1 TetR family transcriptional regulator [Actinophytocola oryzae]